MCWKLLAERAAQNGCAIFAAARPTLTHQRGWWRLGHAAREAGWRPPSVVLTAANYQRGGEE
eukprot:5616116-Prymnesium_polylepis.1